MRLAAVLAGLALQAPGPLPQSVELWGGRTPPEGDIFELSPDGVVFENTFGVHHTVRWDEVKSLSGADTDAVAHYMEIARLAWRARTRLERGDAVTAEPMFEELYKTYEGRQSDMASMVAEGLLRCRLRRSAQTAAVRPWLAYMVSEGVGPYRSLITGALRPACDPQSGLVPSLAPVWLPTSAVEAFARSDPIVVWTTHGTAGPRRAEILETLYRHAARYECGLETGAPDLSLTSQDLADQAIRLVNAMVAARTGNADQRASARHTLEDELQHLSGRNESDAWTEAWCRLGIGRSLLRESDAEQHRMGIVELLHLPARFGDSQPYLAGIALAESALALENLGDDEGAKSLLLELRDSYSTHTALTWEPIRSRLQSLSDGTHH